MDIGLIFGAVGTLLTLVGGGVRWHFQRRDAREASMIAQFEKAAAEAKAEADAIEERLKVALKKIDAFRAAGEKWRMQLVRNGIDPDPIDFPEVEG